MKPRVLHVIDHTNSGGAQVIVYDLMRALGSSFHFAVANLGASGQFSEAYASLGVPVFELDRRYRKWNPLSTWGLIETIRREQYDLVHTHLLKSEILGTVAAGLTGRRIVLHDHTGVYPQSMEDFPQYLPNRLLRHSYLSAYRLALRRSDRVIVLTPETFQAYTQCYSVGVDKMNILPNAVDIHQFNRENGQDRAGSLHTELGLSPETRVVIMVGRLEPEKDWMTFLRVAERVQQNSNCHCAFLVVGSGSEEQTLRNHAQTANQGQVFFLGYRNDVAALLRQADVFLLTSSQERFGIAVLEAMATGCPVVATRASGPKSILTDGVDGLLAEVGDVQGLADHVIHLLHDDVLRYRIADTAREVVSSQYSLEVISARLADIYKEILET